jgi:hypothetical protein
MGIGVVFLGHSGCCMTSTTHLHLLLKLRLSGAIPLLPPLCLHGLYRKMWPFLLMEAAYLNICLQRC